MTKQTSFPRARFIVFPHSPLQSHSPTFKVVRSWYQGAYESDCIKSYETFAFLRDKDWRAGYWRTMQTAQHYKIARVIQLRWRCMIAMCRHGWSLRLCNICKQGQLHSLTLSLGLYRDALKPRRSCVTMWGFSCGQIFPFQCTENSEVANFQTFTYHFIYQCHSPIGISKLFWMMRSFELNERTLCAYRVHERINVFFSNDSEPSHHGMRFFLTIPSKWLNIHTIMTLCDSFYGLQELFFCSDIKSSTLHFYPQWICWTMI